MSSDDRRRVLVGLPSAYAGKDFEWGPVTIATTMATVCTSLEEKDRKAIELTMNARHNSGMGKWVLVRRGDSCHDNPRKYHHFVMELVEKV